MSKFDHYKSRFEGANFTTAFAVQGEAFTDYLQDNLSLAEYSDIYYACECIMNHLTE